MDWQRRASIWVSEHETTVNVVAVLFFIVGGLGIGATLEPEGSERQVDWFAIVLTVGTAITVWWRKTRPLIALPVSCAMLLCYWVLDYPGAVEPVLWLLFFSATRHGGRNRTRVWQVVGLSLGAMLAVATAGVLSPEEDLPFYAIFGIGIMHGTFAAIGEALFQRSEHLAELEQRALAAEADLENKAALAAVEERTRIAREMHDIIAHSMSTVVVQAQAGQSIVETDPAGAREVLVAIERIGRDSMTELRRILNVLREGTQQPTLAPQPTFDDLDVLARDVEAAGVTVDLSISGERRDLPPGLELAGYRVVQEALTNVMRHAGRPVHASASVTFGDHVVQIAVVDDGRGAAAPSGAGHGLRGIRERVEIYNGSLSAGPRPGGGFGVQVSLPIPASVRT